MLDFLPKIIGDWWCRWWHHDIMLPGGGSYECRRCGRRYPVPWGRRELRIAVDTRSTYRSMIEDTAEGGD